MNVEKKWNDIHVSKLGMYSVERAESFSHYCQKTSQIRVILVCILTPIPALLCTILLECLPLQQPSMKWEENWVFWIRFGLTTFMMQFVGLSPHVILCPELNITLTKRLIVSVGMTALCMGSLLLFASLVGFPLPFIWQMTGALSGLFIPMMQLIVVGPTQLIACRASIARFMSYLIPTMTIIAVYPFFKVFYDYVPYRELVIVALPLWRLGAQHFIAHHSRQLEDFIPATVAFSVDFFSTLFVSVCLSKATSIGLVLLVMGVDVIDTMLEFRDLHKNAQPVLTILHDEKIWAFSGEQDGTAQNSVEKTNLLARILFVARNPDKYHITKTGGIRLLACLPHPKTQEQTKLLERLYSSGVFTKNDASSLERRQPFFLRRLKTWLVLSSQRLLRWLMSRLVVGASITPSSGQMKRIIKVTSPKKTSLTTSEKSATNFNAFVRHGLQLLFHCEYLVLVEYIECIVPVMYTLYKSVLELLPNIIYYSQAGSWNAEAVMNIFVLSALEIVSLFFLNQFVRRKFSISLLYQLAFALETQFYMVQAELFFATLSLLQLDLVHLGADFTFHFDWLRSKSS